MMEQLDTELPEQKRTIYLNSMFTIFYVLWHSLGMQLNCQPLPMLA
jgi:hypothetical protein